MEEKVLLVYFITAFVFCFASVAAGAVTALVYEPEPAEFTRMLESSLKQEGFSVISVSCSGLKDAIEANPGIVVLADSRRFPAPAVGPLDAYLKGGGRLFAVGAPAFKEILVHHDGKWMSPADARQTVQQREPEHYIFQFKPGDEQAWERTTNNPQFDERLSVNGGALTGFVEAVDGWNTYGGPKLSKPFPEGHALTIFEARGHRNTTSLFVEWREKDGSRWMTTVPLTEGWKRYVLTPADFKYWADNPSTGRGGPGDRFNPANAEQLWLGTAENFGQLPRGQHIWWVRNVGSSPDPGRDSEVTLPILEALSPSYKMYPTEGLQSFQARTDQSLVDTSWSLEASVEGVLPIWRARGTGFFGGNQAPLRFIPLVDAYDPRREWHGTAAWLVTALRGDYAGAVWGGIGLQPESLDEASARTVASLAARISMKAFQALLLANSGISDFAVPVQGQLAGGANLIIRGSAPSGAQVEFKLTQKGEEIAARQTIPVTGGRVQFQSMAYRAEPGQARLIANLMLDGTVIDTITQPLTILSTEITMPPVRVQDGQFTIEGRPVFLNGINYWPRSSAALERGDYHLGWLNPWAYDPEIVERDLQVMQNLSINLVSIQYMNPEYGASLVDFVERCWRHGMYLNIFVQGAHPLGPNLPFVRSLIENGQLAGKPQVFAYDLAWEPNLGHYNNRRSVDSRWEAWILEQYGSIQRAESDWGFQVPRTPEGTVTGPSDDQLMEDGPWRAMVAAFRRAMDDIISRGYGEVSRFIRQMDPDTLIGVRTGYGGTGQSWVVPRFPFDVASGAAWHDFTSPEAYGVGGDPDNFLAAGFTTEYCRLVGGGKPVFWSEYGLSVWPKNYDPEVLEANAQYYRNMYTHLFAASHTNAAAAWWFPAGFRVDENSDYGLVGQDGHPRPAALVMRDYAPKVQAALPLPAPAEEVLIDRDLHVSGYAGVWAAARQQYLTAAKSGKRLVPVTAGTGTTSQNTPAVAVGGAEWKGDNPPQFLNGEIHSIHYRDARGRWLPAENLTVRLSPGMPLVVRLGLTNTAEARWLGSLEGNGGVGLEVRAGSSVLVLPLGVDVDFLETVTVEGFTLLADVASASQVELRLAARGRGGFGQRVTLRVQSGGM